MSIFAPNSVLTPLELLIPAGLVVLAFRAALQRAGLADRANRASAVLAGVFALWFALAAALATSDVFASPSANLPVLPGFFAAAVIAGLLAFRFSATLRKAADAVPPYWLIGIQVFRVLGLVFIAQLALGGLAPGFALPAGWGDFAVGLLAPVVALGVWLQWPGNRAMGLAWNMLGIADLVTALTMGALTALGPIGLLAGHSPSVMIAQYPLALIPAFGVPLFFFLHFITVRTLLRRAEERGPRLPQTA
jgi:hypothetical protein